MQTPIDTTVQMIGIIVTIAALLGWIVKRIINYFIRANEALQEYNKTLVAQNQQNVDQFKETINHNQTKMNTSIDKLTGSIADQTEFFKGVIKRDRKINKKNPKQK